MGAVYTRAAWPGLGYRFSGWCIRHTTCTTLTRNTADSAVYLVRDTHQTMVEYGSKYVYRYHSNCGSEVDCVSNDELDRGLRIRYQLQFLYYTPTFCSECIETALPLNRMGSKFEIICAHTGPHTPVSS